MKNKPARDVETGDEITFLVGGEPHDIRTISRVVSRRGMVREVIYENGAVGKLRVWTDGSVQPYSSAALCLAMPRRAEPGDAEAIANKRERRIAASKIAAFNAFKAPIDVVRRILAAMEDPANG